MFVLPCWHLDFYHFVIENISSSGRGFSVGIAARISLNFEMTSDSS